MQISLPGIYCFFLEGLFFSENGSFLCQGDEGSLTVCDSLLPLSGKEADLFLCHKPPSPVQPDRWGGGSCYWEPSGKCPAGHHNISSLILRVKEKGVLFEKNKQWVVRTERGVVELPFGMMEGHTGIFAGCSSLDLESVQSVDYSSMEVSQVEILSKVLDKIKNFKM